LKAMLAIAAKSAALVTLALTTTAIAACSSETETTRTTKGSDRAGSLEAFGLSPVELRTPISEVARPVQRAIRKHARSVRRDVIGGARLDFRSAVRRPASPRRFADCFLSRFERELTRARLGKLVALYMTEGSPLAAQALNGLGVPVGDACGGRRWVPQLIRAASGLRADR
jgi:hypothetical protein